MNVVVWANSAAARVLLMAGLAAGLLAASCAASAETAAATPADPIDHLQQRLAEKLGAQRAAAAPAAAASPYDIKVSTRSAPAAHRAAAAPTTAHAEPAGDAAARAHAAHPPHWGYAGEAGPQDWAALAPEFAACSSGSRQSPIDIRGGLRVELEPVQFDYRASRFGVLDNGHTIQVNMASGNSISVMGRRYDLLQFHFHRPSEERIDGRAFDMVAHLVHKDPSGRLAVVAVLLEGGSAQPVVQSVWNNLPLEKGEELPAAVTLDPAGLLPTDRRYYTYMGSLTTPPCTEGVLWMVMKQPVQLSAQQIELFARLYPMNARPVQSASGRLIKESN
jgi:carbonic anhydrase